MSFGFNRSQHLKSKIAISALFSRGRKITQYPVRFMYVIAPESKLPGPSKLLVSVPKKICKLAVERNAMKRRITEAYRLHRSETEQALDTHGLTLHLGIVFMGKSKASYAEIEQAIIKGLKKVTNIIENQPLDETH